METLKTLRDNQRNNIIAFLVTLTLDVCFLIYLLGMNKLEIEGKVALIILGLIILAWISQMSYRSYRYSSTKIKELLKNKLSKAS